MNKYKNLVRNTVIFAIGTFSSKLLTFVMMPVYTYFLATEQYGNFNLIVQTSNLLLPLITVGMVQGIIRFGIDKLYNRSDVFSVGFFCTGGAFLLLLCFSPLLGMLGFIGNYLVLLLLYLLMSCYRQICSQFVRARNMTKLFAFDGMLSTFTNCLFTIIFLIPCHLGIAGALLAVIVSDFLSIVFLFWVADLHKYIKIKGISRKTFKSMIKYAVPMIPTNIFWWMVAVSDQYMVAFMISDSANGIYAAANKMPGILAMVALIFMDAWQISAVQENNAERAQFFSKVFNAYQSIMLFASALLIPFAKIFTIILTSGDYYESWRYIPFLVIATAFCNLTNFAGTVYMVEKRSVASMVTTILGAVSNIVLNFTLIPLLGVQGAAIATFASYFIVFVVRLTHTRQFIPIQFNVVRFVLNVALILGQIIIMILEVPGWIIFQIAFVLAFIALNFSILKTNFGNLIRRRRRA